MTRNRFPGTCYVCTKRCGAGAGVPEKSPFGKWRVRHVDCGASGAAIATALAPAKIRYRTPYWSDARRIQY